MSHTKAHIAAMIDHTLLAPEATADDVRRTCAEALEFSVAAVCVSPTMVDVAVREVAGRVAVASVVGFPSGAHLPETKAHEAKRACETGAREIDMVINLGLAKEGRWEEIEREVVLVRANTTGLLKVIIESSALSDDEIARASSTVVRAGADFVKTSTGFHKSGGATIEAVRLMRATVGNDIGVKASGGVRTWDVAVAMVDAGASRIGTSSTRAILS
ncbi:MAG: deoxyribose-phosphate aldolase [Ilumatobacteraceae bacterium]